MEISQTNCNAGGVNNFAAPGPAGRAMRPVGLARKLAEEVRAAGEVPGGWPAGVADWFVRWLRAAEEMMEALDGTDGARTVAAVVALNGLSAEAEGLLARLRKGGGDAGAL